jgi:hypothetical protein
MLYSLEVQVLSLTKLIFPNLPNNLRWAARDLDLAMRINIPLYSIYIDAES